MIMQLTNRNGKAVANQFVIVEGSKRIFQSYKTKICELDIENGYIRINKDAFNYSMTTSKYFLLFLESSFAYTHKWSRKDVEKWMRDSITESLPLNGQQFNVRTFIAL